MRKLDVDDFLIEKHYILGRLIFLLIKGGKILDFMEVSSFYWHVLIEYAILVHASKGAWYLFTAPFHKRWCRVSAVERRPEFWQEVSQTWQRNVPISPRSCTARRSTASAREWLPPTAVRSWPVAAPRAAPVCPTKRNGRAGDTWTDVFRDGGIFWIDRKSVV